MNDPHVVALIYNVDPSLAEVYSNAKALDHDNETFRITSHVGQIRFEMKQHYATEAEARKVVEPFIRQWQFYADLEPPRYKIRLTFDRCELVDRKPTPGVHALRATLRSKYTGSAQLVVTYPHYPQPPRVGLTITPTVESMYVRYCGYVAGREPLTTMAYFCLTVLENANRRGTTRARRTAAREYRIAESVLKKVGNLTATKGGLFARKASGMGSDLDPDDRRFLEAAVPALILRAAEVASDPNRSYHEIQVADLT